MLQEEWDDWYGETDTQFTFVSATESALKFEVDDVQFIIKAGSEDMELPWLMEIVNAEEMTEEFETWLNDVNDGFQGLERRERPKVFFGVVQEHYENIFNQAWNSDPDEPDENEPTENDNIQLGLIGVDQNYSRLTQRLTDVIS